MARSKEQNEKMREQRKQQIWAEALKQFSTQGLFATRIADIAKGAGIAQGLLYHYYQSKDAIYIDLIDDALDRTIEASVSVRNMDTTAKAKILYSLEHLIHTIESSERFAQTSRLISEASNSSAIPAEAQELMRQKRDIPYKIMAEIFGQGQREGSVVDGDAMQLSVLFFTCINGLAVYRACRTTWEPLPDYRFYARLFLKDGGCDPSNICKD